MVLKARRRTRLLANEPFPPMRCGTGKGGRGRRPGVGTWCARDGRVRASARGGAAAPGGPSGRWSSAVGGGEREKGVARKGSGWEGGSSPPSPHPPVCPSRASPGGQHRPPGMAARDDPRPQPRRVTRDRRGDLPARLSCPTSPPRPSIWVRGFRGGAEPPPHTRLRLQRRSRPPVRDRPPRGASGASRDGWRGGGGSPWGCSPAHRLPAAGPGPVPSQASVLRSRPSAPSPGASACPPSPGPLLRRPSGSLSLSLFPALPRVPPARTPPRFPSKPPLRRRWREGGPGRGCGARAPGVGGGWG